MVVVPIMSMWTWVNSDLTSWIYAVIFMTLAMQLAIFPGKPAIQILVIVLIRNVMKIIDEIEIFSFDF